MHHPRSPILMSSNWMHPNFKTPGTPWATWRLVGNTNKKECSVPAQHHNTVMVRCSWVLLDCRPFCLVILVIYTGEDMYLLIPQIFRHSPLAELVAMAYSFISNLHKCYFTTFLLYFEPTDRHLCQLRARPGLIVIHYLVTHQNCMSNIFYRGIFCNRCVKEREPSGIPHYLAWCERKTTHWNSSLSNSVCRCVDSWGHFYIITCIPFLQKEKHVKDFSFSSEI
jgi:hypothetical protein